VSASQGMTSPARYTRDPGLSPRGLARGVSGAGA
jgi:hypothetical protein